MLLTALLVEGSVALTPAIALADDDAYKTHRDNGLKLFGEKDYDGAIVEFKAAYDAKPKASPLTNIALCYKQKFNYPKAIQYLERALSQHADTMDASDKKAAEDSIKELRALLAYVTVNVSPAEATLVVDGEDQPAGAAAQPVPVGPGTHKIGAKAAGYATQEESVTVASGDKDKVVTLKLVANMGFVTVDGLDPKASIVVDEKGMGTGVWGGLLSPGTHVVRILRQRYPTYSVQVLVVAGQAQTIKPGFGGIAIGTGVPVTTTPTPTPPPPKKEEPPAPPKRGFFILAGASFTAPLTQPKSFPLPSQNIGGEGVLRAGYRVNTPAAFNLLFQYANVFTGSGDTNQGGYTLGSARFGAELRLMTPGKNVRLVGELGGGFTLDSIHFDKQFDACSCTSASGANGFVTGEIGIELDFSNVIVGASIESQYQSSRGISPPNGGTSEGLFGGDGIPWFGGGLRAGYGFW